MKPIDDNLIDHIQSELLPVNCFFDKERRDFIKQLSSCDLLAVPGSGKTTALLAKLICMAQCAEKGDGILVLSHTNAAVNEIKKHLTGKSIQLLEYPHYISTIQEFIDKFLALPYYENIFKHGIEFIDKERYEEELKRKINICHDKKILYCSRRFDFNQVRFILDKREVKIGLGIEGTSIDYPTPRTWAGHEEEYKAFVLKWLYNTKKSILASGVLHYDDCYFLANYYIQQFPDIITILQKRFKYILIDETQDMQFHQLELIDKLFNNTTCILQRVGDPNQSIYNKVVDCCLWTPRNAMFLNNSMRLTKEIADVVNAFTLNRGNDGHGNARFVVSGRRELNNSIAPILILYDEKTMSSLENVFREQITLHNLQNTVEGLKYGFHIIGWNAKETEEEFNMNRLRLEEIFPNYIKTTVSSKSTYNTLCEYIQCQHPCNTIGECYKTILHSLCKILRLSNKKDVSNKYYTIKSIEHQYKNIDYNLFRKKLLLISMAMVEANYKNAYEQLVDYIRKDFLPHFSLGANDIVNTFIGEKFTEYIPEAYQENTQEIPIIIGTVHSVKGMTHCATMYVETFFHKYECKHLIKQDAHGQIDASPYFKDTINITTSRGKQAMKMLYVGMSRPTHLLCYATLKTNWDDISLQKMQDTGWDILDLTI